MGGVAQANRAHVSQSLVFRDPTSATGIGQFAAIR